MRILIVTPRSGGLATGNFCSAEQWREALSGLGHDVEVAPASEGQQVDLLVALHARRSYESISAFPGKVVVVLTGTDIYPEPDEIVLDSMSCADRLVALQSKAVEQVPPELRDKARVILQAAPAPAVAQRDPDRFDIAVVGHLRAVKDPMRAAEAVRQLPKTSKARVQHVGGVLEPEFERVARREMSVTPRYEWLGELSPEDTAAVIAGANLLAVTSRSEGAGRVVGEAIVAGTPVISTRIDGVAGLLGEDYPGYFPVGDTEALAELINRLETDTDFLDSLRERCRALAPQFSQASETAGWANLLAELF